MVLQMAILFADLDSVVDPRLYVGTRFLKAVHVLQVTPRHDKAQWLIVPEIWDDHRVIVELIEAPDVSIRPQPFEFFLGDGVHARPRPYKDGILLARCWELQFKSGTWPK